ncbi:MAG: acetylglutamate kinase [Pseudobdellovibrionaceae bacterium]
MKSQIVVCKIGGAALVDFSIMEKVAELIAQYQSYGLKVVLVHGGGPHINEALVEKNIQWSFVDGLRVTTEEMMGVIEDVLNNKVQQKLIQYLTAKGLWALGVSGNDFKALNCEILKPELGLVGKVTSVNTQPLLKLLSAADYNSSFVPVISSVGLLPDGKYCNINADEVASSLAIALNADRLVFITDQKGVLDKDKQVMSMLTDEQIQQLIENETVTGGMKTKMRQVLKALNDHVPNVQIIHSNDIEKSVWSDWVGTHCLSRSTTAEDKGYDLQ